MGNERYNSFSLVSPAEFKYIFSQYARPNIRKMLSGMSRDQIVQLAILLRNEYCNKNLNSLLKLSYSNHSKALEYQKIFNDFLQKNSKPDMKFVTCFEQLPLEIMRYALSMRTGQSKDSYVRALNIEVTMIKAILSINEMLITHHISPQNAKSPAKLLYVNHASSKDINQYDLKNQFIYQLCQAVMFFTQIENNEKYKPIYDAFLNKFKIDNWRKYVCTIVGLAVKSSNHPGILGHSLDIDQDNLLDRNVLDHLVISLDTEQIPAHCKSEYDKNGNSDYRKFRDRPLMLKSNGDYAVYSPEFLLDRLYSSLYFDFIELNNEIKKAPDITHLFTSEFIEKTLFGIMMKESTVSNLYESYDEDDLIKKHKINNGELGYPDYYLRNKAHDIAILFECKDIRLNSYIKEQRNYELLESELRNKVVLTEWSLDYINKCHKPKKNPERKGVGQLAGHLANIRNNSFPWDYSFNSNSRVYNVLVISDNRLLVDGLSALLQEWYEERLFAEGLNDVAAEKRLIVMSPLCLLKYGYLFARDGFEYYFENYIQTFKKVPRNTLDYINQCISFDDYMAQFPYNLKEKGKDWLDSILKGRSFKNR